MSSGHRIRPRTTKGACRCGHERSPHSGRRDRRTRQHADRAGDRRRGDAAAARRGFSGRRVPQRVCGNPQTLAAEPPGGRRDGAAPARRRRLRAVSSADHGGGSDRRKLGGLRGHPRRAGASYPDQGVGGADRKCSDAGRCARRGRGGRRAALCPAGRPRGQLYGGPFGLLPPPGGRQGAELHTMGHPATRRAALCRAGGFYHPGRLPVRGQDAAGNAVCLAHGWDTPSRLFLAGNQSGEDLRPPDLTSGRDQFHSHQAAHDAVGGLYCRWKAGVQPGRGAAGRDKRFGL